MKIRNGFTLIELVIVIILLGILSMVALPRFVDFSGSAADASAKTVAATLSSAAASNQATRAVNASLGIAFSSASTCADLAALLSGGLPANVTWVASAPTLSCTAGQADSSTCKVFHSQGTAAGFAVTAVCT